MNPENKTVNFLDDTIIWGVQIMFLAIIFGLIGTGALFLNYKGQGLTQAGYWISLMSLTMASGMFIALLCGFANMIRKPKQ